MLEWNLKEVHMVNCEMAFITATSMISYTVGQILFHF